MTKSGQQKQAGERRWLVKGEHGETFGPVNLDTLKAWAQDGRLSPASMVSENAQDWSPATHLPGLGMDWVAEVAPGAFYGPIHHQALEGLMSDGTLAPTAVLFVRNTGAAAPHHAGDARLRHAEARAEEAERALAVCVEQAEQAQQWLSAQVARLTAQVAERDAHLRRFEQQAADTNMLQLLTQEILSAQEMGTRQVLEAVADAQAKAAQGLAGELARGRQVVLDALSGAQEEIAARVAHDVSALQPPPPDVERAAEAQARRVIENVGQAVREAAAALAQDVKAAQGQLAASVGEASAALAGQLAASAGDTAAALAGQAQRLSDEIRAVKAAVAETVASAGPGAPQAERVYVEAEAVEVIPPQEPPPKARAAATAAPQGTGAKGAKGFSMADIEEQARRELEQLGAQGVNLFKRTK